MNGEQLPSTEDLTLHDMRVDDLVDAGWTINPTMFGDTWLTWARLMREQGRDPVKVHIERWRAAARTVAESRWAAGE